jgi:aryl-phospho-beta-D-glucosidase BglC (GH1 family)
MQNIYLIVRYNINRMRVTSKTKKAILLLLTVVLSSLLISNSASAFLSVTYTIPSQGTVAHLINPVQAQLSFLHTNGSLIENQQGQVVILRGCNKEAMEYTNYADVGAYNIQESDFQNIKSELGANVIRVPLTLSLLFPTLNVSAPNPIYLGAMDNIVSWCGNLSMYVIFDLHFYYPQNSTYPGGAPSDFWNSTDGSGISQPYANMITQFWVFIANRYNGNPTVCGFDLYNEPWNAVPSLTDSRPYPDEWATQVEGWIDAITPVNPHLLFIVENAVHQSWGNDDWRWVSTNPVNRPNVVYSPHFYPESEDGSWNDYSWIPLLGSNFTADYSAQNFAAAKSELTSFVNADYPQNVPILIGEFDSSNGVAGLQFLSDYMNICQNNGWSWTAWSWLGRAQPAYCLVEPDWVTLSSQGTIVAEFTSP